MQENDVNKTDNTPDANDAFMKQKVNEFAKDLAAFFDLSDKAKQEAIKGIDHISNVIDKMDRCMYGMRGDIDHLDTRLRDLVLLTKELRMSEKRKEGSINAIVLLLSLIFIALVSLGIFLC